MTQNKKDSDDEKNNLIDINDILQEKKKEIRPMKKEISSENTDNVAYPSSFLPKKKPVEMHENIHAKDRDNLAYLRPYFLYREKEQRRRSVTLEEREFIRDCLDGKKRKAGEWLETELNQVWNSITLHVHKKVFISADVVQKYRYEGDIVDHLDYQLTVDVDAYTTKVAQIFVSAYWGYDTQKWRSTPRAEKGNKERARIADYRFLPEENLRRYVRAKGIFIERLEDVALNAEKEALEQIEKRIWQNPLYDYVRARRQKGGTDLF